MNNEDLILLDAARRLIGWSPEEAEAEVAGGTLGDVVHRDGRRYVSLKIARAVGRELRHRPGTFVRGPLTDWREGDRRPWE